MTLRTVAIALTGAALLLAGDASGAIPRPEHQGPGGEVEKAKAPEGGGGKPKRQQIAGPQQVTREQWEKIVTNMMEVRVSSDGVPTEPAKFALADPGQDEWEAWNRSRDEAR